jgi:hypothetical protein
MVEIMDETNLCNTILHILKGDATEPLWLYEQVRAAFPHTDYLCNSLGELIYYEGEYDWRKHKAAYIRSAMWKPYLKDEKLLWEPKKNRRKFYKLFSPEAKKTFPLPVTRVSEKKKKKKYGNHIQLLMKGTYTKTGEPAVVIRKEEKISQRKYYWGIGDDRCQFKNFRDENILEFLGPESKTISRCVWFVKTPSSPSGGVKIKLNQFKGVGIIEESAIDIYLQEDKEKPKGQPKGQKEFVVSDTEKGKEMPNASKKTKAEISHDNLVFNIVDEFYKQDDADPDTRKARMQLLAKNIQNSIKGVNAHRILSLNVDMDMECEACGGRKFINRGHEYVCSVYNCGVCKKKIHKGLDYRNMQDREVDMNGQSPLPNTLLSSQSSVNVSKITIAPGESKFKQEADIRKIQNIQRDYESGTYEDRQKWKANQRIEDFCYQNHLHNAGGVPRKAFTKFCQYMAKQNRLWNFEKTIGACIYLAIGTPFNPQGQHFDDKRAAWFENRQKPTTKNTSLVGQKRLNIVNLKDKKYNKRVKRHLKMTREEYAALRDKLKANKNAKVF